MQHKDKVEEERPIAYPKPTEADNQLQNQPEYIDEEPNSFKKEISEPVDNNENQTDEQTV